MIEFPDEIEYTELMDVLSVLNDREILSPMEEFCPWVSMTNDVQAALARIF